MKQETTRINYNVPDKLLKQIDEYSNSLGINRTIAINMLCTLALQSLNGIEVLKDLMNVYNDQKDQNAIQDKP